MRQTLRRPGTTTPRPAKRPMNASDILRASSGSAFPTPSTGAASPTPSSPPSAKASPTLPLARGAAARRHTRQERRAAHPTTTAERV